MSLKDFQVLSAVPVMFDESENLERAATRAVLEYIAASGVEQAFVGGTTAEFTALSDSERIQLFELGLDVFGPDRTVAHVGATNAHQAVELTKSARRLGIRRVAAISPYFHPSVRHRQLDYYRRIAQEAGSGGLYIYTYAELTGVAVDPEYLSQLAAIPGVIGTKVSAQPLSDFPGLAAAAPPDFEILWGNDGVFDEVTALGGTGTVSGVSSAFPTVFAAWADALRLGDETAAALWGQRARDAVSAVSCGIGGLKYALACRGLGTAVTRIPTATPAEEEAERICRLTELY